MTTVFKIGQTTREIEYIIKRTRREHVTVPVDIEQGIYRTTTSPDGVVLMSQWDRQKRDFIITEVIEKGESDEL